MKRKEGNILIVDDDLDVLVTAEMFLKQIFPLVRPEQDPSNIRKHLSSENFDIVLLDMNFSPGKTDGKEGIFWLNQIREKDPFIIVIMITAYGEINLAVEAMKSGASDFVVKPWNNEKLMATISSAVELRKSRLEVEKLKNTRVKLNEDMDHLAGKLIGSSYPMKKIFRMIEKVAGTDADVLILGENGTGKELAAREIHKQSDRSGSVFIPVDLGAISESLFESELFGHIKGAFTDAKEDKPGRFELACGGTIFLDEIGNLPLRLQSKILTVLQERKV
ncbi:MAG: sigma-54-dependent Fis family transcriptional regulator, partial [Bacteroidales bacterium]